MADPALETPQTSIESPSRALVVPTESNQFSRAARMQQEHFISGQTDKEFFNAFDETEIETIQVHEKSVTDNIIAEINTHPPASLEKFKTEYSSLQDPDITYNAGNKLVDRWIKEGRFPESERNALTTIARSVFLRLKREPRTSYRVFLDKELAVVDVGEKQKSRILGRNELIEEAKSSLKGRREHDKPTPPVSQHTTLPERFRRLLGKKTIESPQIEIDEPITDEDIEEIVDTLARVGVDEDIRADFVQGLQRGLEEAQTVQNERIRQQEESRMHDAEQADLRERSNNSRPLDLLGFPLAMKAVAFSQTHPTPGVTCETGGQHYPYTSVRVETADGVVEALRIYDTSDAYDTSRTRTQKPSAVQGWLWIGEISDEARAKLEQAGFGYLISRESEEETE